MNPGVLLGLASIFQLPTPSLELAELQIRQAELRAALETLESLTDRGPLDRAGLVRTLLLRLQLNAALKRPNALARDAYDLAALAPDVSVAELRPDAKAAFLRAKAQTPLPPMLSMSARHSRDRFIVRATASGPSSLVHQIRFYARLRGGSWRASGGAPIRLSAPQASTTVEYYGVVIGPGGAVIARSAEATQPDRFTKPDPLILSASPTEPDDPAPVWPWLVGGTAVVVAAAVVAGVVLANNADTRLVVQSD